MGLHRHGGRAATFYAAAAGGRARPWNDARARRVDLVLAVVRLLSAAYCAHRLAVGHILTALSGEGRLLP